MAQVNTFNSRMYVSILVGIAVALALSTTAMANPGHLAALQVPGVERSSRNIDLAALETRINNTDAINIFAKLQLRNRIDSLTAEVGQIHTGQSGVSLTELRQRFEEFLHSTVAMLRKGDPSLADDLVKSRDQLWQVLANVTVEPPDFSGMDAEDP